MGRYYSGDIEGKFWFGLQSSTAANRFGGTEQEPSYITYDFQEEDLEGVEEEIKNIQDNLGDKLDIIEKFFEGITGYNYDMLSKAGITNNELSEYADLCLGIKIRDCIKEKGDCCFDAEL